MRTRPPPLNLQRLEDYRILAKLGEGTFSEVLKAKNKATGQVFAMKVRELWADGTTHETRNEMLILELLQRFRKSFTNAHEVEGLREIQALKRLNPHPNVILLHHVI